MASQTCQLTMQAGPNPGKVFALNKPDISIGRDEGRDIFILDSGVSRRHARLVLQGSVYMLEDLGSTNGTFINGQRLAAPRALQPNDIIMLGDKVRLLFEIKHFDPEATIQAVAPMSAPEATMEDVASAPAAAPAYYAPPRPAPQKYPPQTYPPQQPAGYVFTAPPPQRPVPVARPHAPAPAKKGGLTPMIMGTIGCATLLCIGLLLVLWYIDANYLWCDVLPFIPGCP